MLLLAAVITDLSFTRIPNLIIITGLIIGVFYRVLCLGDRNYLFIIVGILLPVVLFFPLFLIRAMGAGDIKLFAVTGAFFTIKENTKCVILAILIAGAIALLKLFFERNVRKRLKYLFLYFGNMFRHAITGNFLGIPYINTEDKIVVKEAGIKFSVPILLGAIVVMGGSL
ncbi:MAG: prepilin peptidase [Lachnospiraceae bacterium]|nr:prepilin peptidase [Lachnospiraceae bacterium]